MSADDAVTKLNAKVAYLMIALIKIQEGRGRFSVDHLKHAENTIEDMKEIARKALRGDSLDGF